MAFENFEALLNAVSRTTPQGQALAIVTEEEVISPATGFSDSMTLVANQPQQVPAHAISVGAYFQNNTGATVYVGYTNSVSASSYQVPANGQFPFLTSNTNAYWLLGVGVINIIGA